MRPSLIILFFLLAPACRQAVPERPVEADEARPVEAPVATPGEAQKGWIGVLLPLESVDVAAQTAGRLERVTVRPGDRVRGGDLLARVDTSLAEQDLRRAEAALRVAQAELTRARTRAEQERSRFERRARASDVLSREEVDAAELDARAAEAEAAAAEARVAQETAAAGQLRKAVEQAEIRAPFDGIVALRHLDAGATVAPGTPVARVVTGGDLLARFAVPSGEIETLAVDRPVAVVTSDGSAHTAIVSHVAPELDLASQMVFVEARLGAAGEAQAGRGVRVHPEGWRDE